MTATTYAWCPYCGRRWSMTNPQPRQHLHSVMFDQHGRYLYCY